MLSNTLCSDEIIEFVNKLFELIFFINKNKKTLSLRAIFNEIITRITPYGNLSEMDEKLANIDIYIFREIINDYAKKQPFVSIKNFNEYIETIKNDKQMELPTINEEKIDAVNILTIHSSKGLEFPYIFLAGIDAKADQDRDTSSIALEMNFEQNVLYGLMIKKIVNDENPKYLLYKTLLKQEKSKAEKLRLFYVALSRAKKYLNVISYTDKLKPVDYIENLQAAFPNAVEIIDADEIELEKQELFIPLLEEKNISDEKKKASNEIVKEEKITFSFSKIHTFNNCQNEFLLQYKYGFPKLENKNQSFLMGSIIHNLIYLSFLNKKVFTNEEIQSYLKNTDLSDDKLSAIFNIYKQFADSKYTEYLSQNNLQEYGFDFNYDGTNFKGDIDLIIFNKDKSINIIDFKTNKNIEKNLPDYTKQMVIYKKAMENEKFVVKNLIILNIKEDDIKEIILEEKEIIEAENALNHDIKNITDIKNMTFSTDIFSEKCETCGYNYICQNNK